MWTRVAGGRWWLRLPVLAFMLWIAVRHARDPSYASLFAGGVATKNESVEESIKVIRSELERMARFGRTGQQAVVLISPPSDRAA